MTEQELEKYQVDHLILLVGGNPLPNAVAGKLLARHGKTISLIYSEQTATIKDRLADWLRRNIEPPPTIRPKKVGEADPYSIYNGVKDELKGVDASSVNLHYTGGTKAMSAHAYLAAKQWLNDKKDKVTFHASYLDSHTLSLVFDPADPESGQKSDVQYVGLNYTFDLVKDFLYLHHWELFCPFNQDPILLLTTKAMVDIHTDYTKTSEWRHWLKKEPNKKWNGPVETWTAALLPQQQPEYARLGVVVQALRQEVGLVGDEFQAIRAAHLFHPCPEKRKLDGTPETAEDLIHKWLKGGWLENYVLQVLQAADLGLRVYQGVETKNPRFEVDVVAIRGYQLFLFSCTTQTDKGTRGELKLKLLEASVRAAQLGGDEARVALVCCADDARELQNEMRLELESNRIRVFGLEHLADLGTYLARWIRTESKEGK